MKKPKFTKIIKHYGYMSSANRGAKRIDKKQGKQKWSVNKLDEGCFELENHK
jgi:hypothetical protein